MELPKFVYNWKQLLWRSWVNRVLYLMFAVQVVDILINVANSQPVEIKDMLLTGLTPIGVWVRLLSQAALATSVLDFSEEPTTILKGDPDDQR